MAQKLKLINTFVRTADDAEEEEEAELIVSQLLNGGIKQMMETELFLYFVSATKSADGDDLRHHVEAFKAMIGDFKGDREELFRQRVDVATQTNQLSRFGITQIYILSERKWV